VSAKRDMGPQAFPLAPDPDPGSGASFLTGLPPRSPRAMLPEKGGGVG